MTHVRDYQYTLLQASTPQMTYPNPNPNQKELVHTSPNPNKKNDFTFKIPLIVLYNSIRVYAF
jgi:hypothetical protein